MNSISFYCINWGALLILIILLYRIRHTGDDTFLKLECMCLVGVWAGFTVIQYCIFIYNYVIACRNQDQDISDP